MEILRQAITNQTFLQSVLLLLLTAMLTGILVPLIKTYIDNKNFERQKRYEAELALESKKVEARSQLLEDLAQALWEYHNLCYEVVYYRIIFYDEARYKKAIDDFHEKCWLLYTKAKIEEAKARRLVSGTTHREIAEFVEYVYDRDTELATLIKENAGDAEWEKYRMVVRDEWQEDTKAVLGLLAAELKLIVPESRAAISGPVSLMRRQAQSREIPETTSETASH